MRGSIATYFILSIAIKIFFLNVLISSTIREALVLVRLGKSFHAAHQ